MGRPAPLEAALTLIAGLKDQRDNLYARTVNPRRNAERAQKRLLEGEYEDAAWFLLDVVRDLNNIADLYRDYTRVEVEREKATQA
jgi:hypothetical protein